VENEYRLPDRMGGWAVLDVGAQTGTFAHAAGVRGAAVIHCYEPDPASLAALLHNAAAARGVRVFAEAVCASGGRASPATSAVPGVGVLHASDPAGLAPAVTLATAIERARRGRAVEACGPAQDRLRGV
jgi:FkbM family methyltransferase